MGRLRILSGSEACSILAANGFARVRQKGSHITMQKRTVMGTITAIVPDHRQLRIGTLMSIIRQSQLPKSLFETE